jgi:hypothetical protein
MRMAKSNLSGILLTLAIGGCFGGEGSGIVGISGGGNGNGGNGTSGLGFFVQPNSADVGQTITPAIEIVVRDSLGGTDSSFTGSITISLASNPTAATLSGTTVRQPVNGIASFTNLAIDRAGTYTLQASASGAVSVTSGAFTINAP